MMHPNVLAQARIRHREALAALEYWKARDDGTYMSRIMVNLAEVNATSALARVCELEQEAAYV